MYSRLRTAYTAYPGQFWLMFVGMFLSTLGASMTWPFLMIYVTKRLDVSLTVAASLFSLNSVLALAASFLGGPLLDRIGRKWIMVFSLFANGAAYIFLGHAGSYAQFALLLGITGAVNPLYRAGADAMMADLLPAHQRVDGYSLMRLSNNLGISIGPVIGGFVATTSYTLAFYFAAAGMIAYSLLMAGFGHETLPERAAPKASAPREFLAGYPAILTDGKFMAFLSTFTLVSSSAILIWTIMAAYANKNFGISENVYKWIPVTNALMVVTLQQLITRFTKRRPPLFVLAAGSLFYAVGVGAVALATSFFGFWVCMVVMTLGELMLAPTSSTYAANLAPAEKRGRYMSLYGLSWPVGQGVAPVAGGFLSDTIGIRAPWVGGGLASLIGMLIFLVMARQVRAPGSAVETPAAD